MSEWGLYVGRFQPFHNGHLEVIHHILRTLKPEELLIGIGSAQASHTVRDPFTAGERFEMIVRTLEHEQLHHCWVVPIPDVDRHAIWVSHIESLLPPFEEVYSNDPLTRMLFEQAGYHVPELPFFNRGTYEGTEVRRRIAAREAWLDLVPAPVRTVLDEVGGEERIRLLAAREAKVPGREDVR